MAISVTEPIGWAISRAKLITFQPFNLGKWITLGFVAWLATLDEGGGGGTSVSPVVEEAEGAAAEPAAPRRRVPEERPAPSAPVGRAVWTTSFRTSGSGSRPTSLRPC